MCLENIPLISIWNFSFSKEGGEEGECLALFTKQNFWFKKKKSLFDHDVTIFIPVFFFPIMEINK